MAQNCSNYGIYDASIASCQCPAGLGGTLCTSLTCSNPILPPRQREILNGNSCDCTDGFTGVTCNVCTTTAGCNAGIQSYPSSLDSSNSASTGLSGSLTNNTVVCNTSPRFYTEGFLNCDVKNIALQSLYPGSTYLAIQETIRPNGSISYPIGDAGTAYAQLFYVANSSTGPAEQFYCQASNCASNNYTYTCQTLNCTCPPENMFCSGAGNVLDLTNTIDSLQGPLEIQCLNASDCNFKQPTLQSLFGADGLGLSGCQAGECVRQSVIDALSGDVSKNSSGGLTGGVIAGLAVVGLMLLGIAALYAAGKRRQKLARNSRAPSNRVAPPYGLSWQDIRYTLPPKKRFGLRSSRKDTYSAKYSSDGQVILQGLSGYAPAGSMLAIIGSSGAGKSTLVDILAGKRKVGQQTGIVTLVNEDGSDNDGYGGLSAAPIIGYVDQDDVLPGTLTVREALAFAAELKLPENSSHSTKAQRIDDILSQLGLQDVADSRIGSGERRGISGGERRRLSIGLELIAAPSILILDEPTTGLDSVSALKVIQVLRSLATGARQNSSPLISTQTTIIATIHQPSSRVFHTFDHVSVLAKGGRQVYIGREDEAEAYFTQRGLPLPQGFNLADHLLEISMLPESQWRSPKERFLAAPPLAPSTSYSDSKSASDDSSPPLLASYAAKSSRLAYGRTRHRNSSPVTTLMTQLEALSWREMRILVRNRSLLMSHVGMACILGVFLGGMYYQADDSIAGFQNRIGCLFFLGALLAFSALSALANVADVRHLFLRERAASYYTPFAWLCSRIIFDLIPLRIIPTIIVSTIAYWMVGLQPTAAAFFKFLLILVEFSMAETLFNFILAAVIPSAGTAILLSAVINLFQMAFAGFFVNLKQITPVLRWLQWLDPIKYMLEALAVNEVGNGLSIIDTIAGVKIQVSASLIMNLLFGFHEDAYYRDVLVLFGWLAAFFLVLVFSVFHVMREIR